MFVCAVGFFSFYRWLPKGLKEAPQVALENIRNHPGPSTVIFLNKGGPKENHACPVLCITLTCHVEEMNSKATGVMEGWPETPMGPRRSRRQDETFLKV